MKRKATIIIIILSILVLGIVIYQSPDEVYWHKDSAQNLIEIGRSYAWYIFLGNKETLRNFSIEPAKSKIEKSNIKEISNSEILEQLRKIKLDPESLSEKKQLGKYKIISPLFAEKENIELLILERMDDFIVMTFGCEDNDNIIEIPEKGKMLFSICIRYYKPRDNRFIPKLIRKIANIPFLRNYTVKMGTTGRWVMFDYDYKYNQADYFNWILKEGVNLNKKYDEESKNLMVKVNDAESFEKWRKEIINNVNTKLDFHYGWANIQIKKQMQRVENSYR